MQFSNILDIMMFAMFGKFCKNCKRWFLATMCELNSMSPISGRIMVMLPSRKITEWMQAMQRRHPHTCCEASRPTDPQVVVLRVGQFASAEKEALSMATPPHPISSSLFHCSFASKKYKVALPTNCLFPEWICAEELCWNLPNFSQINFADFFGRDVFFRKKASSRIRKDGKEGMGGGCYRGRTQFKNEPPWYPSDWSFFEDFTFDHGQTYIEWSQSTSRIIGTFSACSTGTPTWKLRYSFSQALSTRRPQRSPPPER